MSVEARETPLLLSIEESARALGMSISWMKQQKSIPYVRVGRRKLFTPESLRDFIDRNVRGRVAKR